MKYNISVKFSDIQYKVHVVQIFLLKHSSRVDMSGLSAFYLANQGCKMKLKKDQLSIKWIGNFFLLFPILFCLYLRMEM